MNEPTLERVQAIFDEALSVPQPERSAFIEARCADNADLRAQVESLLAHASVAEGFLEHPPQLPEEEEDTLIGARLGAYVVEEEIASGGMGRVYRARRGDDEFEQRVAIKVIKPGLALPGAVERFRAERALLARLDHPRIARLLDGGTTPDGRPYLVMDHVEGVALDKACAGRSVEQRLDLFEKIAETVAYAHARLVVHRDLKPSNILVTGGGEPRLLDFGVAKVLKPDAGELTVTGERPLTPQYASPEQVRGEAVTTATDVYALGLLLYEMLTGRRPYELRSAEGDSSRVICETTPSPPSAAASDAGTRNRVRGDLDRIVLKALEKDPAARYGSATQLAEDIGRWRRREPVLAGPDTAWYRVSRGMSRHKAAAVAGALAIAALVFGLSIAVIGYSGELSAKRAEREARLAAEQAERAAVEQRQAAEQVSAFLDDMLSSIDPNEARDRDTTLLRGVLDRAAGRLAEPGEMDTRVRAPLEIRVGSSYVAIGELDAGADHLRRAIDRLETAGEGDSKLAAEAWHWLGRAKYLGGDLQTGHDHVLHGLALRRAALPEGAVEIAQSLNMLGAIRIDMADYDGAAQAVEESLPIWRRHKGSRARQVLNDTAHLAGIMLERGQTDRARTLLENAEGSLDENLDNSPLGAALYNLLAITARRQDRLHDAERYSGLAIESVTSVFGPEHPTTLTLRGNYAVLLESLGRLEESEREHLEVLALKEAALGEEHHDVVASRVNLITLRTKLGRHADAVAEGRSACELAERVLGTEHPIWAMAQSGLGVALMRSGSDDAGLREAERCFINALETFTAVFGEGHNAIAKERAHLAELYGPGFLDQPAQRLAYEEPAGGPETDN